jgi:hypothetical protein
VIVGNEPADILQVVGDAIFVVRDGIETSLPSNDNHPKRGGGGRGPYGVRYLFSFKT